MVSIRRRRLLGLDSGSSSQRRKYLNFGCAPSNFTQNTIPVSEHPTHSVDAEQSEEEDDLKDSPESSDTSGLSLPEEQHIQQHPKVKRRKPYRRKHVDNQEPCLMRGVYFKNMKWQAAIKVDRKQIHLGTVSSPEEAARLYDRAAFMCRRETNFQLSEEEKQELSKYEWDEFLEITRSSLNKKRHLSRMTDWELQKNSEPLEHNSDCEGEQGVNTLPNSEDNVLETDPNDLETQPNALETDPNDLETDPNDLETHPNDLETHPNDLETHPNELETHPNDLETHPSLEDFNRGG